MTAKNQGDKVSTTATAMQLSVTQRRFLCDCHLLCAIHRVGILAGVFDPFSKPFPRQAPYLAYHHVVGDSAFGSNVKVLNVTAVNWTAVDDCGGGHAFLRTNPTSLDLTPPQLVRVFGFEN